MRLFAYGKDGGPESLVWGYWLIELKWLFSIVLLCFEDGTREAYHDHAFNAVSWVLRGRLREQYLGSFGDIHITHTPTWRPIITRRSTFHQVRSTGRTWVLSFRGPWADRWHEYVQGDGPTAAIITLTHGRKEVA